MARTFDIRIEHEDEKSSSMSSFSSDEDKDSSKKKGKAKAQKESVKAFKRAASIKDQMAKQEEAESCLDRKEAFKRSMRS